MNNNNSVFNYNSAYLGIPVTAIYYNKSLYEWCNFVHMKISTKSGWHYGKLNQGTYGFDSNIECIYAIMHYLQSTNSPKLEDIASVCHNAWCDTYNYWSSVKPYNINPIYKKPRKPFGDYRRQLLSNTTFTSLPDDEQEKIIYYVRVILDEIFNISN
jgi:hypothetical protein